MKKVAALITLTLCLSSLSLGTAFASSKAQKPSPDEAIVLLKEGNARFVAGQSIHPRMDAARLAQAGKENQGDHAYATVITCSDSRVPVELLFDSGIMDIFVIRGLPGIGAWFVDVDQPVGFGTVSQETRRHVKNYFGNRS